MAFTSIYSYFYDKIKENGCNECSCKATFTESGEKVDVYCSICQPNMISVTAYNLKKDFVLGKDIDVDVESEECPFSDPTEPKCVSTNKPTNSLLLDAYIKMNINNIDKIKINVTDEDDLLLDLVLVRNGDNYLDITILNIDPSKNETISKVDPYSSMGFNYHFVDYVEFN